MPDLTLPDVTLHWREDGDPAGPVLVLGPVPGFRLSLWEEVVAALPPHLRVIRFDLRGQGRSSAPPAPWSMGALVRDAEALMDHLSLRGAVYAGVSLGGMIAQGLAVKRPDLLKGLILSGSATKIGTTETWAREAELARSGGMEAVARSLLPRWFPRFAQGSAAAAEAREQLLSTPEASWRALCGAMAGTDFYATTARLTLPALVLAGANDGAVPPDLQRETAGLMEAAGFEILRSAGHLLPLDRPQEMAAAMSDFMLRVGDLPDPLPGRAALPDLMQGQGHGDTCGSDCGCGHSHPGGDAEGADCGPDCGCGPEHDAAGTCGHGGCGCGGHHHH